MFTIISILPIALPNEGSVTGSSVRKHDAIGKKEHGSGDAQNRNNILSHVRRICGCLPAPIPN